MAMRDEDFGATLTLTEADGGLWSPPKVAPASETRDWRSLYEQAQARAGTERARADAAEARCEELRRAESDARSRAGSLKWALDKSRHKLQEAVEDLKEVRRASKDALFFQAEVTRLEKLLSQAGVDSRKRSTIVTLRMEVFQLREALQAPKPGKDTAGSLRREVDSLNREDARLGKALDRSQEQNDELAALRRKVAALRRSKRPAQASRPRASVQLRKALERAHKQKDTIKALRGEVGSLSRETRRLNREARRLRREQERLQDLKATVRWLTFETRLQRGELAGYHDQMDLIEAQESRIIGLHVALRTSAIKNEKLEAELAERPLLSAVFRTVRDRDKTIVSLHKEIARGRKANDRQGKKIKALRAHRARLQARIAQLRSTRAVLSKAVFGGRSERQETPRSERKRGQQRGRARPRPHPAANARGEGGSAGAAGGRTRVFLLRQALCRERRAFLVRHRDRGQGPYPQDRTPALPPGVRLPVLAPGSDGAPAGAVVPQDPLRDQRLGAHPVRALRLLPAPAPGRGVDDGPGAGDRAGDDSRQRASLPAAVHAARRGDPRLPETRWRCATPTRPAGASRR